jgi:E3 ubiquitin-protein ligase BRE1
MYAQTTKDLSQCERQRRKAEEDLKVVRKETERLKDSVKSRPTSTSQKEAELQKEVKDCYVRRQPSFRRRPADFLGRAQALLKCSTCGLNMRNTYLTKCNHSALPTYSRPTNLVLTVFFSAFCKQCIDSRMSTRQRKCPACNLAFGAGDVQHFYFQ